MSELEPLIAGLLVWKVVEKMIGRLGRVVGCAVGIGLLPCRGAELQPVWEREIPDKATAEAHGSYVVITSQSGHCLVLDLEDGRTVLEFDDCPYARFSGGLLWLTRTNAQDGSNIEGYDVGTRHRRYRFHAGGEAVVGGVVNGRLIYGDTGQLARIRLSDGKIEQTRPQGDGYGWSKFLCVGGGRVLFQSQHYIYGYEAMNFKRGWWNYSDVRISYVDELGIVCGGWVNYWLAAIRFNGKHQWLRPIRSSKWPDMFANQHAAANATMVGAAGQRYGGIVKKGGESYLRARSPYLFGLDRMGGFIKWKVPMIAMSPVGFGDKIAVVAGHRTKPHQEWYLEGVAYATRGYRWRVEVRRFSDGRLIGASGQFSSDQPCTLTATSRFVLMVAGRRLKAFSI